MAKEGQNVNTLKSFNSDISNKIHQVTIQDLISFKEELLKDLRNYKSKVSSDINSEFEKYNILIEKSKHNLNYYEKDKSSFMTKVDFTQEQEKLFFEVTNKNNELKNHVMVNQVHIASCRKDLDDYCYKYDKIVSDNLLVPGLIGKSCKYQNLKEYILSNKEEINNALFANRQAALDLNIMRKKMDASNNQLNNKIKSLEYRLSNFITSKFNEIAHKFEGLYEELNKRMNTLTHEVNSNIEERNNELARMKNFVFEENSKAIENVKTIKSDMLNEFKSMKNNFKTNKKNILNLTNLLMGRSYNQNRQFVINNFNNMMLDLFKEFGIIDKNQMDKLEDKKARMSYQINYASPAPLKRKNTLRPQASSYIKEYIEGKITSDETVKHKKSFKSSEKNVLGNNDISTNNEFNIISSDKNNNNNLINSMRDSLKNYHNNNLNLKLIKIENSNDKLEKHKKVFSDNAIGMKNELNKDINQLNFEPKKKFTKKNTAIFINIPKNLINNEIIHEEDSNKYFSSNSNSNDEQQRKVSEKMVSSKNIVKKKSLNTIDNLEKGKDFSKRNTVYGGRKFAINSNTYDKNSSGLSESESSSFSNNNFNNLENTRKNNKIKSENINFNNDKTNNIKIQSSISNKFNNIKNKNNINNKLNNINNGNTNNLNNIKNENTNKLNNINNENTNKSNLTFSTNQKNSLTNQKSDDFKITNNYSNYNQLENKKKNISEEDNNNIIKKKKSTFIGLKAEKAININIENKINSKQIKNKPVNKKNNFSENIKLESIDKLSFINKFGENKISLKKNNDLKNINENFIKTDNLLLSYNNIKKMYNERLLTPSNKINVPRKTSPIIIKSRIITENNKIINNSNNNDNNILSSNNSNYVANTEYSTKKELLAEKTKNKKIGNTNINEMNNKEGNEKLTLIDKKNIIINKNRSNAEYKLYSAQKTKRSKLKFNKNNILPEDKEIYLTKDALTSTRYIKDEDIIDKPLLIDSNLFKLEQNKGNLENKIAELEYFTKKKLDELVKEIKIFIPIHFNSHIRNYSVEKNKK